MKSNHAVIHPNARVDETATIEPFAVIGEDVEIGPETWIGSHVVVMDGARIGAHCRIFPGAVISAVPQDLKYRGEKTFVEIGDHTTIRECATVNKGTAAKGVTRVGEGCLIMAYVHIAHDCEIGNQVILVNSTGLAGEVVIEDFAYLGGMVGVHQFVRIGAHTMVQGGSMVGKDIPPFLMAGRNPVRYQGINVIGLRRRGFSDERVEAIHEVYRYIYQKGLNTTQALERMEEELADSSEKQIILRFIQDSTRGIIR